ncbi:uncharacterized protein PG986_003665 [Apiospora aurea]|uniref:Uncharacterized protein n=1 Tax=Apiospora aurea TaxID=335848 RepID=A0ABR1QSC1_9PEZI
MSSAKRTPMFSGSSNNSFRPTTAAAAASSPGLGGSSRISAACPEQVITRHGVKYHNNYGKEDIDTKLTKSDTA